MNKFRKIVLGGAAVALAVVAGHVPLASGQEGERGGQKHFARRGHSHGFGGAPLIGIALKHRTELNLSADQIASLEKIKEHYQSQIMPVREQLMAHHKEMRALTQQSPANLIDIKAKIQEAEKLRSELMYLRIEALENGRSVLTAEQQDQLKDLMRSRHRHFRKPQGQAS